jgi:serine/threonine protein kinase
MLHRDLKSPNILVDGSWRAKVADFGLSKMKADNAASLAATSMGGPTNPMWLAPEVLSGEPATEASDVYAFGIIMWELLTWELPWVASLQNMASIYGMVMVHKKRPPLKPLDQLPGAETMDASSFKEFCGVMERCWAQEPQQRPAFAEAARNLRCAWDVNFEL